MQDMKMRDSFWRAMKQGWYCKNTREIKIHDTCTIKNSVFWTCNYTIKYTVKIHYFSYQKRGLITHICKLYQTYKREL